MHSGLPITIHTLKLDSMHQKPTPPLPPPLPSPPHTHTYLPPKELWAMSRVHWRQQHKAQKENGLVSGL